MNTDKIWEKYSDDVEPGDTGCQVIFKQKYEGLVADILSSQWQTREPTREDGDKDGLIIVRTRNGHHTTIQVDNFTYYMPGCYWMSIPKIPD